MASESLDRRRLRLPQHVEGAGQQHRDGAGAAHRGGVRLAGIFDMVGRQGSEFGGERGAADARQLLGMEPERQPGAPRRLEDPPRLVDREGDAVAEGVDHVGEAFPGRGGQHLVADASDIGLARHAGRKGMRAQKARDTRTGLRLAEASRRTQHAQFGFDLEAIAGLDLDRRDALGE